MGGMREVSVLCEILEWKDDSGNEYIKQGQFQKVFEFRNFSFKPFFLETDANKQWACSLVLSEHQGEHTTVPVSMLIVY